MSRPLVVALLAVRHFGVLALALPLLMVLPHAAPAAVIVNWGGDYVPSNQNFSGTVSNLAFDANGGGVANDILAIRPFSDVAPLSPPSNYNPPAGKSGVFFGGYQTMWYDNGANPTFARRQVNQSGTIDRIAFGTNANALGLTAANFVIEFQKPNFLAGYTTQTVDLGQGASIAINTQSGSNFTGRFLVMQGDARYLSNTTFSTLGVNTLSDPSADAWAPYDPTNGLDFNASAAVFSPLALNDVQAVGYYLENDGLAPGTTMASFVRDFTVTVPDVATPEPATLALLGVGVFSTILARRRRA